eukprot:g10293.t1
MAFTPMGAGALTPRLPFPTSTSASIAPKPSFVSTPFDVDEAKSYFAARRRASPGVGAAFGLGTPGMNTPGGGAGSTGGISSAPVDVMDSMVHLEITNDDPLWTYAHEYLSKQVTYDHSTQAKVSLRAAPGNVRKSDSLWDVEASSILFAGSGGGIPGMKGGARKRSQKNKVKEEPKMPNAKFGLGWHDFVLEYKLGGCGARAGAAEVEANTGSNANALLGTTGGNPGSSCDPPPRKRQRGEAKAKENDHGGKKGEAAATNRSGGDLGGAIGADKGKGDGKEARSETIQVPITLLHQRIGNPVANERGQAGVNFFRNVVLFCRKSPATDALKAAIEHDEDAEKRRQQEEAKLLLEEREQADYAEKLNKTSGSGGATAAGSSSTNEAAANEATTTGAQQTTTSAAAETSDRLKNHTCSGSFALLYLCKLMLSDAQDKKENQVSLWRFESQSRYWSVLARRWARSMDSVVVEDKTKKQLLEDLLWFERDETRAFYKEHGIPYHRCYLFHGPPGAGKTSLIYALAGHLERNLAFLQVSREITDDAFRMAMEGLPLSAMLVMEDVDSMFTHDREASSSSTKSSLSFSGFLNTLDGLAAPDNLITFLTTNHPEKLDPAVLRPGRIDLKVEFKAAGREVATQYFKTFYKGSDAKTAEAAEKFGVSIGGRLGANKLSMAQLQHYFLQCHRLEKDAGAAAEWVKEFRFDEMGGGAAAMGNGIVPLTALCVMTFRVLQASPGPSHSLGASEDEEASGAYQSPMKADESTSPSIEDAEIQNQMKAAEQEMMRRMTEEYAAKMAKLERDFERKLELSLREAEMQKSVAGQPGEPPEVTIIQEVGVKKKSAAVVGVVEKEAADESGVKTSDLKSGGEDTDQVQNMQTTASSDAAAKMLDAASMHRIPSDDDDLGDSSEIPEKEERSPQPVSTVDDPYNEADTGGEHGPVKQLATPNPFTVEDGSDEDDEYPTPAGWDEIWAQKFGAQPAPSSSDRDGDLARKDRNYDRDDRKSSWSKNSSKDYRREDNSYAYGDKKSKNPPQSGSYSNSWTNNGRWNRSKNSWDHDRDEDYDEDYDKNDSWGSYRATSSSSSKNAHKKKPSPTSDSGRTAGKSYWVERGPAADGWYDDVVDKKPDVFGATCSKSTISSSAPSEAAEPPQQTRAQKEAEEAKKQAAMSIPPELLSKMPPSLLLGKPGFAVGGKSEADIIAFKGFMKAKGKSGVLGGKSSETVTGAGTTGGKGDLGKETELQKGPLQQQAGMLLLCPPATTAIVPSAAASASRSIGATPTAASAATSSAATFISPQARPRQPPPTSNSTSTTTSAAASGKNELAAVSFESVYFCGQYISDSGPYAVISCQQSSDLFDEPQLLCAAATFGGKLRPGNVLAFQLARDAGGGVTYKQGSHRSPQQVQEFVGTVSASADQKLAIKCIGAKALYRTDVALPEGANVQPGQVAFRLKLDGGGPVAVLPLKRVVA